MPRPAQGYRNAAGLVIPGTSDILKRYMNSARLLYWAFNRGKQGNAKLYDDHAINIGTVVHKMAELDLTDQPQDDIEFYATTTLGNPEHRAMADSAFTAFKKWREAFHVRPHVQEVSLVSEQLQYGGTLDTVAVIRNGLGIIDFKTTAKGEVYEDHVLQLAAYGILWNETHPGEQLTAGYHLILLPKEGGAPIHREYSHDQLHPFRQRFWLYRKAFELEATCCDPKVLAGIAVAPSPAPKRRSKAAQTPPPSMTMGEMLRAYGHLNQHATV